MSRTTSATAPGVLGELETSLCLTTTLDAGMLDACDTHSAWFRVQSFEPGNDFNTLTELIRERVGIRSSPRAHNNRAEGYEALKEWLIH